MWMLKSNRHKHFIYAIPIGMLFTLLVVIGLAVGMEFKDKQYGNEFDWLDLLATVLGGIIGQLITIIILILL